MSEQPIPPLYAGLVDDAALFPPGNAPMPDALAAHATHRASWYDALVGPFLCPDGRLGELRTALAASGHETRSTSAAAHDSGQVDLGLIVTGGAGAIEPAITWVRREPTLALRGLEIALKDEPDPARNVERIALALRSAGLDDPDEVPISVEIPLAYDSPYAATDGGFGSDTTDALDALAEHGYRAKLRTGTPDGSAPSPEQLARFVLDCLDRELPFKCTAGLHHAVRPEDSEQHGFLNLLAATRTALAGSSESDLIRALAETDPLVLQADLGALDDEVARSVRRWLTSFGSCSIAEPLSDLTELELVREPS